MSSVAKGLDKQKGYKATSKYKKTIVPFLSDLTLLSISCGNPSVEATMNFESLSALLFSATDLTLMQSVSIDLTLVQSVSVGKSAERKYHQRVSLSATLRPNKLLAELCSSARATLELTQLFKKNF